MKMLLIRHGETEWNKLGRFQGQKDIALNPRGLAQAKETAQALDIGKDIAIYSSPLHRTMQLAQEISQVAQVPVVPVPSLKELALGDLEGVTGAEMRSKWPQVYATWRNDPGSLVMPNGESLVHLQERAWRAVTDLEQAHGDDDVLVVVSHNFAIRAIIGRLLGMPLSNFHRMTLSLSSICNVEIDGGGRRLVSYNSTCHLSPENR